MSNCIKNISLGNGYGVVCKTDGSVSGWGYNNYNQAAGGNSITNAKKVDAGMFTSIALRNDGTIRLWGNTGLFNINKANSLTNISDVSIHNDYALVLSNNGTVSVIENTFYSDPSSIPEQIGPSGKTNVTGIGAGYWQSYIVFNNGNMSGYGEDVNGRFPLSLNWGNIKIVKVGGLDSFGILLSNGRISGWGFGTLGGSSIVSTPGLVYENFGINGFGIIGKRSGIGVLDYYPGGGGTFSWNNYLSSINQSEISEIVGSKDGADTFGFVTTNGVVNVITGSTPSLPANYAPVPNICNLTSSSSSSSSSLPSIETTLAIGNYCRADLPPFGDVRTAYSTCTNVFTLGCKLYSNVNRTQFLSNGSYTNMGVSHTLTILNGDVIFTGFCVSSSSSSSSSSIFYTFSQNVISGLTLQGSSSFVINQSNQVWSGNSLNTTNNSIGSVLFSVSKTGRLYYELEASSEAVYDVLLLERRKNGSSEYKNIDQVYGLYGSSGNFYVEPGDFIRFSYIKDETDWAVPNYGDKGFIKKLYVVGGSYVRPDFPPQALYISFPENPSLSDGTVENPTGFYYTYTQNIVNGLELLSLSNFALGTGSSGYIFTGFSTNKSNSSSGVAYLRSNITGRLYYQVSASSQLVYDTFSIERKKYNLSNYNTIDSVYGLNKSNGNFYVQPNDIIRLVYNKNESVSSNTDEGIVNNLYVVGGSYVRPDFPPQAVYINFYDNNTLTDIPVPSSSSSSSSSVPPSSSSSSSTPPSSSSSSSFVSSGCLPPCNPEFIKTYQGGAEGLCITIYPSSSSSSSSSCPYDGYMVYLGNENAVRDDNINILLNNQVIGSYIDSLPANCTGSCGTSGQLCSCPSNITCPSGFVVDPASCACVRPCSGSGCNPCSGTGCDPGEPVLVDCSGISLTIEGYAFYRDTPGVSCTTPYGSFNAKCGGGHVCNRTDFLPTLRVSSPTGNSEYPASGQITLNNSPGGGARDGNFTINIPDSLSLSGASTSFELVCKSPGNNCHNGVTYVVMFMKVGSDAIKIFDDCIAPSTLQDLPLVCSGDSGICTGRFSGSLYCTGSSSSSSSSSVTTTHVIQDLRDYFLERM